VNIILIEVTTVTTLVSVDKLSEWVSSFLTAHQHILGYSVQFIHSVLLMVW